MARPDHGTNRFAAARDELLDSVLAPTRDERIRSALRRVPREEFVLPGQVADAYKNVALPIGDGQTISQPLIVEQMTTALQVSSGDRVLEIGTGSGYQAAILSLLVSEVITVELIPRLVDESRARLGRLGYENVRVLQSIGPLGWPQESPYDGIIVTAGAPNIPLHLLEQLAVDRCMVVPVGLIGKQELLLVTKQGNGHNIENLGACAFVPLIGQDAWPPEFD